MLRNILVILLVTLGFVAAGAATPQDTLVSKAYVQQLEERVTKLERDSSGIALGKERLGLIHERIDNLQAQGDRSSADLANMIAKHSDWVTILMSVFGLFLVIGGFVIGAFINSEQKKTGDNLRKTDENLKKTENILEVTKDIENKAMMSSKVMDRVRDEVNQVLDDVKATRELIDNNIGDLYKKLQAEEVNFHIDQIRKDPTMITPLFERLKVLPLNNDHFHHLKDLVANSEKNGMGSYSDTVFDLILYHFPQKWLEELELKVKFMEMNNYVRVLHNHTYSELIFMVDNICEYLRTNTPVSIDYEVGSAVLAMGYRLERELERMRKVPTPPEVRTKGAGWRLTQIFYDKLERKELRFRMYDEFRGYSGGRYFWDLLQNDYSDQENNTEEENYLLNVCKDVYLKEDKAEAEKSKL